MSLDRDLRVVLLYTAYIGNQTDPHKDFQKLTAGIALSTQSMRVYGA